MSQSGGGSVFGFIMLLVIGYFVVIFAVNYWFLLVLIIAALIILYAHFLGSLWGRRRVRWRIRFGTFGTLLWVAMGTFVTLNAADMMARGAIMFTVALIGLHVAGWIVFKFLGDMLFEFFHEDEIKAHAERKARQREEAQQTQQRERQEEAQRQKQREQQQEKKRAAEEFQGSVTSEKHALELFELSKPFSMEQLRTRRMELLKKVHPDQGGSNMMARLVNEAYDVLKTRVS